MFVRKALAALALALLPASALAAAPPAPDTTFFPETGHSVSFGFKHFFETRGGLDIFGYPTTEEIHENGWTVQYFQRARFEYHPEFAGTQYEVELGLLGDLTAGQTFDKATPQAAARFYPETSHNLSGAFQQYFDSRGGLDIFGYPTSEPFLRQGFTVQYFQRARMELHGSDVLLGLLGDEYLQARLVNTAPAPAPSISLANLTPPMSVPVTVIAPPQAMPIIRVAVLGAGGPTDAATANVSGNGPFTVSDATGRQFFSASAGQIVNVTWNGSSYDLRYGTQVANSGLPPRFAPAPGTILDTPDLPASYRDYRGVIEADYSTKSSKLWLVNELPLEDYVKGIGEEPEGFTPEAYKALSVSYRTYALATLTNHRNDPSWKEPFDLGSSTTQVTPYNGANQIYAGQHRETAGPLLTQGANATTGQVLMYNGAVAITPYYSHSDGRTRSWSEVWHGNDHPWLISVPDPDSNGEQMLGHGVGMPLQSAIKRASAGWAYDQILRYFYTGVQLTRLW
ncbi:MAG: hypothetical protein JO247_21535 [Chloroflexi bacterium]|nr:hypothetical protein [Chloroflexota bacterium]